MYCTMLLSAHVYAYVIDHEEPEPEEPMDRAQIEVPTNLVWIKASPGASHQLSLVFLLVTIFCVEG
jgi:hypothetical protein